MKQVELNRIEVETLLIFIDELSEAEGIDPDEDVFAVGEVIGKLRAFADCTD